MRIQTISRRSSAGALGGRLSLTELVDAHDSELVQICIVAGATPDLAREAVQNAWLRAAPRLASLRDPDRVRPWLIAIAVNEVRQLWRRQRTGRRLTTSLRGLEATSSIEFAPGDVDLHKALRALDPLDRQVIALTYVAGLDSTEIGQILGLTAAGVRTRRARILHRVRKELEGG